MVNYFSSQTLAVKIFYKFVPKVINTKKRLEEIVKDQDLGDLSWRENYSKTIQENPYRGHGHNK